MSVVSVALYRPQIPPNTGNISRLCVGLDIGLTIVGKAAFEMSEKKLQRAGLDYWPFLKFRHFQRYKDFHQQINQSRVICISKEGQTLHWNFSFQENDILLFGNETAGLPPKLLKLHRHSVRLPMYGEVRSLNLSNAVAVVAYEALRQLKNSAELPQEILRHRKFYKKKTL